MKAFRAVPLVVVFCAAVSVPRTASAQLWVRPSVDLATTHLANGVQSNNSHVTVLNSATVSAEIFSTIPYVSLLLGGSFERYTEQDPFVVTCGTACDLRFPNFNGLIGIAGLHIEPLTGLGIAGQVGMGACSVTNAAASVPTTCSSLRVLRGDLTLEPFDHLGVGIRWERMSDDNIAGNPFSVNSRMLLFRIH